MKRNSHLILIMAFIAAFIIGLLGPLSGRSAVVQAVVPDAVIDDFEDGDASDWIFFGGNAAGGGGGALSDRPQEGSFYLSTGWGGDGSNWGHTVSSFKAFNIAILLP